MSTALFWFRNDLRLNDNPALSAAMASHDKAILIYILDETLGGAQHWWLHHSLLALQRSLLAKNSHLILLKGEPLPLILNLINTYDIQAIYWNRVYTPDAILRDTQIKQSLKAQGISVKSFNSSLLHEPGHIMTQAKSSFKVFTPFWRHTRQTLQISPQCSIECFKPNPMSEGFVLNQWALLPVKPDWASRFGKYFTPGEQGALNRLDLFLAQLNAYASSRDIPAIDGTSKLSPHLHFGEISPHTIWRAVLSLEATLNAQSVERFQAELGWREFSYYLLYHFPNLPKDNFNSQFNHFPWLENKSMLEAWKRGQTGFPIVDAGMRELWQTGYMHNRVRMIVASFLVKDLLIDWREGAEWFLDCLLDADLASNSASWQWVAGRGADAAPYFRIFNPTLQSEKFDPEGLYIKKWVPELKHLSGKALHTPSLGHASNYPKPIVDHAKARALALAYYQGIKAKTDY